MFRKNARSVYIVFRMKTFMLVTLRPNSIFYWAYTCTWHLHVRLLLNEIISYHDALFRQLTSIFIPFSMKFSVKRLPKRRGFGGKCFRQGEKEREIFVKTFFSDEIEKLIAWRNKCRWKSFLFIDRRSTFLRQRVRFPNFALIRIAWALLLKDERPLFDLAIINTDENWLPDGGTFQSSILISP